MTDAQHRTKGPGEATQSASRIVDATTRRMERMRAFDDFRRNAKDLIAPIAERLQQWRDYDRFYRAHVVPGGWDGGSNDDHVDIILGDRPVHIVNRAGSEGFYTERGAWLRYERTLAGQVNVFMYPPVVSAASIQYDNFVILDKLDSAKELTTHRLSWHIRQLSAWMAGEMLDQVITLSQRPTYVFVWACKHHLQWDVRLEQYVRHPPRMFSWMGWVAKWTLTVGLSGAILFFLQRCTPPEDTVSPLIREQTNSLFIEADRVRANQDALLDEGRKIRDTADATLSEVRGLREDIKTAGQEAPDALELPAGR